MNYLNDEEIQEVFNELDRMRSLRHTWLFIASTYGTSVRNLRKWRENHDYHDPRKRQVTDEEIDQLVYDFSFRYPNRGENQIQCCFEESGVYITRERLRASIARVDPEGKEYRRNYAVHRRIYKVKGPHALWHLDGNHKLIFWGL